MGLPAASSSQHRLIAHCTLALLTSAGTRILDPATGEEVGKVTSGTFSPSLKGPVSMGYVKRGYTKTGTTLAADVRGRTVPVVVSKMPFVEQRYYRGPGK